MSDHAYSSSPAVQTQLDRLWKLSPGADILGLERITRLLARLGNPHLSLPPAFHVAGTNGKGSTCAFLRAALEAAGYRVHVYSSPHLCRFNERIRLAGTLIDDEALAALLAEVLDKADGIGASFFEITTAAAFLAFARTPADACVIEVGLGGRLDATNVIAAPAVCGIAALGIDHQSFLGNTLIAIAREKAGVAKSGAPLITMAYPPDIAETIARSAEAAGASLLTRGEAWQVAENKAGLTYSEPGYALALPHPALVGTHQADNYALAVAMLRHQRALSIPEEAMRAAAHDARWPARMQRLGPGPLTEILYVPYGIWIDGAHNPSAAEPVADAWRKIATDGPSALVIGMLANKDADAVLAILARVFDRVVAVPIDDHEYHDPDALAAIACRFGAESSAAPSIKAALSSLATAGEPRAVLIAGSLYLAGEALAANDEMPT